MRKSVDIEDYNHGQPIPMASKKGPLLMSGGIAGLDTIAKSVPDDAAEQTRLMFENVEKTLTAAGGSFEDVVKMTFYVKTQEAKASVNAEWVKAFPDEHSRPARHTRTYEHLPRNCVIQCDVTAWIEA